MAAKPFDDYNPVNTVAPETSTPNDYLNVRANPNDFGAQVGGAVEKAGQVGQQLGEKTTDLAIQQQGMINETLATNAESKYLAAQGALTGKFKSMTGLEAVSALPQYTSDIQGLRDQFRNNLPAGANRAFDLLAIRHEGYALGDANNYAATQIKQASNESNTALISQSVLSAGHPQVATDPARFGSTLGDIKAASAAMLDQTMPGLQHDPDTGAVTFASTPEGQSLKADYQNKLNHNIGLAYESRFKTLGSQNPQAAQQEFDAIKDSIPRDSQVRIQASLEPQVTNQHTDTATGLTLNQADAAHRTTLLSPPKPVADVADAIHMQESGGKASSVTSVDGAVGGYQITPGTFAQYAHPGEDINNPKDNAAVGQRIIDNLKQKYPDDPARVATAYFSGPGNVAPAGSQTPYIHDYTDGNGKSVSSYVKNVVDRMGGNQTPAQAGKTYATNPDGSPLSQADYYASHRDQILANGDAMAEQQSPGNLQLRNQVRERLTNQMNAAISSQSAQYKQDNSYIQKGITGDLSKGEPPRTYSELRALPGMADVLDRSAVHSPEFTRNLDTSIQKMQRENSVTNSPNFYDTMQRVLDPDANPQGGIKDEDHLARLLGRNNETGISAKDYGDGKQALGFSDAKKTFLSDSMKQVAEANGNTDGLGTQRAAQYYQFANKMWDEAIAKGASEQDLTDSDSKDYLGRFVPIYSASKEMQIKNAAQTMRKTATVAEAAPRQAGETPEQYLSRAGL